MDDLEEIWGPRGRATVDPGSVRAAASPAGGRSDAGDVAAATATPLLPAPPAWPRSPAPPAPPVPTPPHGPAGEIVPAVAPTGRPPHLAAILGGAIALAVAVAALAVAFRPSERPAVTTTAGSTATTIVSAAADLLGRSKVSAPTEATTTSVERPASTTPPAPPTTAPTATAPSTTAVAAPSRPAPASTAGLPPLAQAEDAARQFIDILHRRDCDGLWSMLSRGTQAFLTGSAEPGEPSGRDALCDSLRSEEAIPPMRVHGPAEWRGAGAVVPLESEGEVEELAFVAEDGRWLIDLFGDLDEES